MSTKAFLVAIAIFLFLLIPLLLFCRQAGNQEQKSLPIDPEKGMSTYVGLRNQALHNWGKTGPGTEPQVVLMDWGMSRKLVTVVAYADGTASIYTSTGGGFLGGGQRYESIRKAGQNMIAAGRELLVKMRKTQDYPLPQQGQFIFYVVTNSGVFTASAKEVEFHNISHPFYSLFAAGQEVITQYRLNTQAK